MEKKLNQKIYIDIINKIKYFSKKQNKVCDTTSLSYLIKEENLSQSDKIKLGNSIEKILNNIIIKYKNDFIDIKEKNFKNIREKDSIFIDNLSKKIIYAEFKGNLNLDTEKSKSTVKKIKDIEKELKDKYKNHEIFSYLVCLRYLVKKDIPNDILKKYTEIKEKVIGINDFLKQYKLPKFPNYDDYKIFLKEIVKKIKENRKC